MEIMQVKTGTIDENCYLVYNDQAVLIIDPGADAAIIAEKIAKIGQKPVAVLITHTHWDHIGAVEDIRHKFGIPVYVSPLEQSWLGDPAMNLSYKAGRSQILVQPAEYELENRPYELGNINFRVVPTPGHSIGSVSFIFDDFVVVGDALFRGSIGRTDLPTGNLEQLLESIQTHLFTLPEEFTVFPGHGDATTVEHERNTNPFFN